MPASNHSFDAGDLQLAGGGVLPHARIDYRVHGKLADDRGNLVLFPHMYSGGVGSLDRLIGSGRALDPSRFCVLVPGQLGNGVSSSPSNSANGFPALSAADDVEVQRRLVAEVFGDAQLQLVAGYSMGAHQAYEWALAHPLKVERLMVLAGSARTRPRALALLEQLSAALEDAAPLRRHAELWRTLGVSGEVYRRQRWREAGFESEAEFVRVVFDEDLSRADPRDLLCQLGKWASADVSRHAGGDLPAALRSIRARTCVVPFKGDPFAPPAECAGECALIDGAVLRTLDTCWGHYAFAGFDPADTASIDRAIEDLLERD